MSSASKVMLNITGAAALLLAKTPLCAVRCLMFPRLFVAWKVASCWHTHVNKTDYCFLFAHGGYYNLMYRPDCKDEYRLPVRG